MTAARGLAFTTPMGMVDRVHDHTANGRANTAPAFGAGLAQLFEVVLAVRDLAYRRAAVHMNLAHLAGAKKQRGVAAFARNQLDRRTGRACHLTALARLHLHVVDRRSDRNRVQLHRVARLDRRFRSAHHVVAREQILRREDITPLTVCVLDQRDVRTAIRIVFDPLDRTADAVLVALEIDDAIALLVTTALMTGGDPAVVVTAAGRALGFGQRLVRLALPQMIVADAHQTATARRCWFCLDDCHACVPGYSLVCAELFDRLTGLKAHIG